MEHTVLQEHRCTACGQQMHFDPERRVLSCVACRTEAPEVQREETAARQTAGLTCPNCGADLPGAAGARQASCGFCDSVFTVLREGEDCPLVSEIPEHQKYVLPFPTNREAYQQAMISWLAREKGTPVDAFEQIGMIRGAEGYYIPHYLCVASYHVHWTASIGYDRIETYTAFVRTTVNGRSVTRPVTRTRIVTDWFPHSAMASGLVPNESPAVDFLQDVFKRVDAANTKESLLGIRDSSSGRFSQGAIALNPTTAKPIGCDPFDTKYTAGFHVLPCELPATRAYDKHFIHAQIARAIEQNAPGDRIRNLQFHGDILPDYSLVYVPVWLSIYSYHKKICASHAEGARVDVQYGTRPIDKDQKKRARRAFLPLLIAAIVMLINSFIARGAGELAAFAERMNSVFAALVLGTLIAAFVIRWRIFRKSKHSLMQQLDTYRGNPSKLFGRKSSKTDPIRDLIK